MFRVTTSLYSLDFSTDYKVSKVVFESLSFPLTSEELELDISSTLVC